MIVTRLLLVLLALLVITSVINLLLDYLPVLNYH